MASLCLLSIEYEWFSKETIRVIVVLEEVMKMYSDTMINVSFGATITRFAENELGGTFVAFYLSLASLAYNWPSTIILLISKHLPTVALLIGAFVF